jgi:hypothetical protein
MLTNDMFPGTDLNDLNLDWIIETIKDLEARVQALEDQQEGEGG